MILSTTTFDNDNYSIIRLPTGKTCREMVSYIAQLSGNYAHCNTEGGDLILNWYNGSADVLDGNADTGYN